MSRQWMLTLLLAVPLAVGQIGCGKKKTEEGDKSAEKTGPGPGHGTGRVGTTVALPTAAKPIDTQYISDDFIAAVVLHPARALDSKLAKGILAEAEKVVGKQKVDDAFAMLKQQAGVDPRKIEQVIVLVDGGTIFQLPKLFQRGQPDRGESRREFRSEKSDGAKRKPDCGDETDGDCLPQGFPPGKDGRPRRGMSGPPMPSVIVRFNDAVDKDKILSNLAKQLMAEPKLKSPKFPSSKGPRFPDRKGDERKPSPPPAKSKPPAKSDAPPKASSPKANDESGCLADDAATTPKLPTKTHDGKTYQLVGPLGVCFIDDKTLLASPEPLLKKMISAKDAKSPLTGRLKTLGSEHDLVVAFDASPITNFIKDFPAEAIPKEFQEFAPALEFAKKIKTIAITASISSGTLASIVIQMPTENDAKGFATLIRDKGVKRLREEYANVKKNPHDKPPKEAEFLVTLADQMMAGLSVGPVRTDVVIAIARPAEMDNLPSRFGPAFKAMRKAARGVSRKNDLRNIGLALHNHHAAHGHFPAADSNGYTKERGRKAGLSWRVHLLPMLDQKALYDQFKLDEAWDSPHNKALISKMPALFANPTAGLMANDGKTALHVFVGRNNTPFSMDGGDYIRGGRLRDIVDGSSNTIAVVEAGIDKAEIWTKPGGLPFDPAKNPWDALGRIPESGFLVLMCDGSVHTVARSRSADDLKALIQHDDGKYVPVSGRTSDNGARGATQRSDSKTTTKPRQ